MFDNVVDNFVYNSMIAFPSIFPTREKVLVHTLMVIGNGHDWVGDEIISDSRAFTTIEDALNDLEDRHLEGIRRWKEESHSKGLNDIIIGGMIERRDEEIVVIQNAHTLAVTRSAPLKEGEGGHYESAMYDDYALMFNRPKTIHKDWLAACYEVTEYVRNVNEHYDTIIKWLDEHKNGNDL